jgi:hypothetical protein
MLLRLAFYESVRRTPILENRGLARVHVFRKRLPMMHRDGWEGRKANSGMAFAWFVWDDGRRLTQEEFQPPCPSFPTSATKSARSRHFTRFAPNSDQRADVAEGQGR